MYQYKAILKSNNKVIAEDHTLNNIIHDIKRFRRQQNKKVHTQGNEEIRIYHQFREGNKRKLIKTIAKLNN